MGQWLYLNGKLKQPCVGVEKSNINIVILVIWIRPETEWSNHEQVEDSVVIHVGGPNSCLSKKIEMICG